MSNDGTHPQGLSPGPVNAPGVAAPGPLVMVADDHADTRDLLRILLESRGCVVVDAADGAEAVEVAERTRPALALLDVGLPKLDGLGVARRLRGSGALPGLRVVGVSGHASPLDRELAMKAGCDGYLVKPFTYEQLHAPLDQFLPARR